MPHGDLGPESAASFDDKPNFRLSDYFRASQLEALNSDPGSFLVGGVGAGIVVFVVAARQESKLMVALGVALLAITLVRILSMRIYRAAASTGNVKLGVWEFIYHLGATTSLALLGFFCAATFAITGDAVDRVLATTTVVAYMAGIPGRNFASRVGVFAQIAGGGVPLLLVATMSADRAWLLLLTVLLPFVIGLNTIAKRLRRVFLDATSRTYDLEILTRRFKTALNAMSHGFAIHDESGQLVAYNERLLACLGLESPDALQGATATSLVKAIAVQDVASRDIGDAVSDDAAKAPCFTITTQAGHVLEVTSQKKSDGGVILVQDVTMQRRASEQIERLAWYDGLTGLANRARLNVLMREALASCPRLHHALLFVDLDHFKRVNDTLGHEAGDKLVQAVAARLCQLAPQACISRLGGDEFLLFVPELDAQTAAALGAHLTQALAQPFQVKGRDVSVGASIGISLYPDHGSSAEELVRTADIALYRAKNSGRNLVRVFSAKMDEEFHERSLLALDLRRALRDGEFELCYQPIYNLHSQTFTSCEALVRWRHPEKGLLPPAHFIEVAEETGFIIDLTSFVLRRACEDCASWHRDVSVAVNISAASLAGGGLVELVHSALRHANLPPHRLEIELTESSVLDDAGIASALMHALRISGVGIALDDFGTGYSSLSQLSRLPLQKMKIDRSFLREIETDERAALMLRGMARLGTELGLKVVVEGVETEAQFQLVSDIGSVDGIQGFFFSRPIPSAEVASFLAKSCAGHDRRYG